MAVKDHTKHFSGLNNAPTLPEEQVPNTVSRHARTGDRAFTQVVAESGKPVLDAELNLAQDAAWFQNSILRQWQAQSGWLRGRTHLDGYCDFTMESAPVGITDDSESGGLIAVDRTLVNSLILPKLTGFVAGYPILVEYTNTATKGHNLIELQAPTVYDGTDATVKRTDFVFLEVWKALVAPSPKATGTVQVVSAADIAAGDSLDIGGTPLTATLGAPAVDQFQVVAGDEPATATNIANAINDVANSFDTLVSAVATLDTVVIKAIEPGAGTVVPPTGNNITLAVTLTVVGSMVVSGPTLTGGEDRPGKPETGQGKLFRHGNVLSPEATWLDDELVDPVIDLESSQRVQIQYRIRVTGATEGVNHKTHPDGFSTPIAGGGGNPAIFAQGGRAVPVHSGNGIDVNSYPFVPANGTSTWLQSSAAAYDLVDDGLWVAGDGSERAAQDLSSVDGFVYAIPLGMVFRHNNVSDALAGFKGFDPINNTNGAPLHDHVGYNGPLGAIPAATSDRPDGHFADVPTQDNLWDLRRHIVTQGVDLAAELQYQMQSLLDGSLRTWAVDAASKQTLGGDSGDVSTRFLVCNEIGRTLAVGGNPPFSGDTSRGVTIRNFDHIARRFGDQPIVERHVVAFYPGDRPDGVTQGGPVAPGLANPGKYVTKYENPAATVADADAWYEGDTLHLDLEELNATTLGGLWQGLDGGGSSAGALPSPNFANFAPIGTVITDVLRVWHDDGHYTNAVAQDAQVRMIQGLGTQHLTIVLDRNQDTINGGDPGNADHVMVGSDDGTGAVPVPAAELGSPRRILVEVELTYPIGVGTTDTVDHEVVPDPVVYDNSDGNGPGPVIETATSQRPNDYGTLLSPRFRSGYREIQLEYVANNTLGHDVGDIDTGAIQDTLVSQDPNSLVFPRRLYGTAVGPMANQTFVEDAVVVAAKTVDEANTDFGSSTRLVNLDIVGPASPLSGAGQTLCNIRYFAQDPIPNYGVNGAGYQVGVYFRTNAPQTAGVKEGDITTTGDGVLPTTLRVEPLLMSPNLWTGQVGMGGQDKGYPYLAPLDQVPMNDGSVLNVPDQVAGTTREWYYAATAQVAIDDFDASTGLLALHPFVQGDVQNILSFGGADNTEKPRKDAEFRAYYPFADDQAYRPTIMSQPLFGATRHKVMVPFLARAVEDVPGVAGGLLFRKSEVLLVVMSRHAVLDDQNNVMFTDTGNTTAAAVYKTRNHLLVVGDRTCLGT